MIGNLQLLPCQLVSEKVEPSPKEPMDLFWRGMPCWIGYYVYYVEDYRMLAFVVA